MLALFSSKMNFSNILIMTEVGCLGNLNRKENFLKLVWYKHLYFLHTNLSGLFILFISPIFIFVLWNCGHSFGR